MQKSTRWLTLVSNILFVFKMPLTYICIYQEHTRRKLPWFVNCNGCITIWHHTGSQLETMYENSFCRVMNLRLLWLLYIIIFTWYTHYHPMYPHSEVSHCVMRCWMSIVMPWIFDVSFLILHVKIWWTQKKYSKTL